MTLVDELRQANRAPLMNEPERLKAIHRMKVIGCSVIAAALFIAPAVRLTGI